MLFWSALLSGYTPIELLRALTHVDITTDRGHALQWPFQSPSCKFISQGILTGLRIGIGLALFPGTGSSDATKILFIRHGNGRSRTTQPLKSLVKSRVDVKRKMRPWIWWIPILLALLAANGLPAQQHDHHQHSYNSMGGNGDWSELMSGMDKMHADMESIKPSGDSDLDFVRLMIPHHQAAIDMAKTELMHGNDPVMRRLAQEIITDQQSEIELMNLWVKQHKHQ